MIIDDINAIIKALPKEKLETTLMEVKILAFKMKNENLKNWAHNELFGYSTEIPKYRHIPTIILSDLANYQFGGVATYSNYQMPTEKLDFDIRNKICIVRVKDSVSALEHLVEKNQSTKIFIPQSSHYLFREHITEEYEITSVWQHIEIIYVSGVISKIKITLLDFLLKLLEEIHTQNNTDIMEDKKIDNLFDKTIGNLNAKTVNFFGNDAIQVVGDDAKLNIANGNNNTQNITIEQKQELEEFITELEPAISKFPIDNDMQQEIIDEIATIKLEISKQTPKSVIISTGLQTIYNLLVSITANAMTSPFIASLSTLLKP